MYQHMREFIDVGIDEEGEQKLISTLPVIKMNIHHLNFKALIDTGAEISLIKESIIQQNQEVFKTKIVKFSKVNLVDVNGKN